MNPFMVAAFVALTAVFFFAVFPPTRLAGDQKAQGTLLLVLLAISVGLCCLGLNSYENAG